MVNCHIVIVSAFKKSVAVLKVHSQQHNFILDMVTRHSIIALLFREKIIYEKKEVRNSNNNQHQDILFYKVKQIEYGKNCKCIAHVVLSFNLFV